MRNWSFTRTLHRPVRSPFKSSSRFAGGAQILYAPGQFELLEFAQRRAFDIRKAGNAPQREQGFGVVALERLDRHRRIVTHHVMNVKRD